MPTIRAFIRTYQNVLISFVILVFCVVGIVAGVIPSISKIQTMYKQTQELAELSKALQQKLSVLSALDEQTLRTQLDAVISAVPSDRSLPTVFSAVEGVAAQTQVGIVAMSISGDTTLSTESAQKTTAMEKQIGTHTIPFSVSIEGPLASIRDFITLAPRVRRMLRIHTFSITFPEDNRPININIKMDAFYETSPASIGRATDALPTLSFEDAEVIEKLSSFPLANASETRLPPPAVGSSVKENPFSP